MLQLAQLNKKFANLAFRLKIELYLLPFLICYLISFISKNEPSSYVSNNLSLIKTIQIIENQKFNQSFVGLLKELDIFFHTNKIKINSMNNTNTSITYDLNITKKKFLLLSSYLEQINKFSAISAFEFNKKHLLITITFDKFYLKQSLFLKDKISKLFVKQDNFFIDAIVGNMVFINNKWLKVNDYINKYKIIRIQKDYIYIKYKGKNKKIRLYTYGNN